MDSHSFYFDGGNSEMHGDMRALLENLPTKRVFDKDEIIYHQGDTASSFYYLKNGKVNVFMTSPDGMEKTLNTASGGELLGEGAFFDKKPRVSSARAVSKAELVVISEKQLLDLIAKYPRLAFEFLEILSNRIRLLSSQLDSMTFMQADARIARLLLENENGGKIKLTHEEIANSVGVSRVTVSKTLSKFARQGIIETCYKMILIKNSKKLSEISES